MREIKVEIGLQLSMCVMSLPFSKCTVGNPLVLWKGLLMSGSPGRHSSEDAAPAQRLSKKLSRNKYGVYYNLFTYIRHFTILSNMSIKGAIIILNQNCVKHLVKHTQQHLFILLLQTFCIWGEAGTFCTILLQHNARQHLHYRYLSDAFIRGN